MMRSTLFIALFALLASCNNGKKTEEKPYIDPRQFEENLQEANKLLARSEDDQINDFVYRMGWKMSITQTGLRYWIYKPGEGKKVNKNAIVRFNFKVELINGFVCYDSDNDGFQEIKLGRSTAPGGLEEGLALLSEGDKAKLILPSHLAYGLLGDQDKIPTRAILIYDVEVLQVR
jgi:FKBP-type peptidyl-prolyl cis-trans isomerase FkpA